MGLFINTLIGFIMSSVISFILYFMIKVNIVSKDNEKEILNFYEKDLKNYNSFFKNNEDFNFNLIAFFIGLSIAFYFYSHLYFKSTELINHFENINKKHKKSNQ